MSSNTNYNLGLILGVAGTISGIVLVLMGNYIIGIAGGLASAGLAYKGYQQIKKR